MAGASPSKIPKLCSWSKQSRDKSESRCAGSNEVISKANHKDDCFLSGKLCRELKDEWCKKSVDMKKVGSVLSQLKLELTKSCYMPLGRNCCSKTQVLIARDMLEIHVAYCVSIRDMEGFARNMAQLKCYYSDYKDLVSDSSNMYKLLGLNMLFLLCGNKVAEFYLELETIPPEVLRNNKFIKPILEIEQYFMEGRYNKIFEMNGSMPSRSYQFFMTLFLDTIRNEIGDCIEKAYEKISLEDAARKLNLSPDDVKSFAEKRKWSCSGAGYYVMTKINPNPVEDPQPCREVAEHFLGYARDLEQII